MRWSDKVLELRETMVGIERVKGRGIMWVGLGVWV